MTLKDERPQCIKCNQYPTSKRKVRLFSGSEVESPRCVRCLAKNNWKLVSSAQSGAVWEHQSTGTDLTSVIEV